MAALQAIEAVRRMYEAREIGAYCITQDPATGRTLVEVRGPLDVEGWQVFFEESAE